VANLQAVYYRGSDAAEPVRAFVDSLKGERRVAVRNQIDRLNLLSDAVPHLAFPHSSQVAGELPELRCHYGSEHYRVLYQRSGRLFILLHAFRKTSAKIPLREIATAQDRFEDFKRRMDAEPRRRPRAAGHDAP